MFTKLNTSWLNGKYPAIDAAINTSLPSVEIGEYFWQGEEAYNVIDEIYKIWLNNDLTQEEAITKYSNFYL